MVMRTNIKLLSSYHIDGWYNYVPKKTKLDQIIFMMVNGFIPNRNDILGKSGRCVKVGCVSIGCYTNATCDYFSREYHKNGTFTYPHIPENRMRVE